MKLRDLAKYKNIVIQCHDVPDADAVASGFALQSYFKSRKTDAALIYGGSAKISKPNLVMMTEELSIKIDWANEIPADTDLLVTVDCQRGGGNVFHFDLPKTAQTAVFDHHRSEIPESENVVIRPYLTSCSTLIWDMLSNENYKPDDRTATALFYGLFTDSNGFSELRHLLDRDLAEISSNAGLIKKLKNAAITMEELDIIGHTLGKREVINNNIGVFSADPCDANLLGFTSDIAQQVAHLDCCIVCCEQPHGLKLSVRSSAREIMASEIAAFVCKESGNGGGNIEKAGGFMNFTKIKECSGGQNPYGYLVSKVREYSDNYDLIYADNNDMDFASMKIYQKLPFPTGFAVSAEIFPEGSKITVRTLEGDIDAVTGNNIYLMIGIQGEVYPIFREKFEASYNISDLPYAEKTEYTPAILNRLTGERKVILPFAKTCVPKESKLVRAKALEKDAKLFTHWDTEKYFTGSAGDYIVANEGSYPDCYIVRGDIFLKTYKPI